MKVISLSGNLMSIFNRGITIIFILQGKTRELPRQQQPYRYFLKHHSLGATRLRFLLSGHSFCPCPPLQANNTPPWSSPGGKSGDRICDEIRTRKIKIGPSLLRLGNKNRIFPGQAGDEWSCAADGPATPPGGSEPGTGDPSKTKTLNMETDKQ